MGQQASRDAPSPGGFMGRDVTAGAEPSQQPQPPQPPNLSDYVPDRLVVEFHSRRQQLVEAESALRGRLFSEYRAQIRDYEPTLRLRGEIYADVLEASLKNTPAERLPVRELAQLLDPLITPVLSPFVEGLQAPINQAVGEVRTRMYLSWAAAALGGAAAGFVLGRWCPPREGGKRG